MTAQPPADRPDPSAPPPPPAAFTPHPAPGAPQAAPHPAAGFPQAAPYPGPPTSQAAPYPGPPASQAPPYPGAAYPQPYAPYGAPAFPPPPPARTGTNGFAIASLVFACLGGILFAVVFGIVGLVQTRRRNQSGRGVAIAGLAVAGCWVLVFIAGGIVAVVTADDKPATATAGAAVTTADASTTELQPGDCIRKLKEGEAVLTPPAVPCSEAHEGEVYAEFQLPAGAYPGEDAVFKQADERCAEELDRYAPDAPDDLDIAYLYPTARSWFLDRVVTCIAGDPKGPTTGSLLD